MDQSGKQEPDKKDKKNIKLSVVVATYNGEAYIDRCLDSFTRQSISSENYEVIIVNNNSSDNTKKIALNYATRYDHYILVDENKPGVSFARNRGISIAKGNYICFIDDDAYAHEDWLKNVLNAFKIEDPKPAVVGGEILPYYNSDKPVWFDDSFEIRTKGNEPRFLSINECYSGFPESNYSVRKDVLDEVGGFSADFGPKGGIMGFGEGSELSRRITNKYPHFWYNPDIIVYHLVRERNMSIKYILSRKYKTAYLYQALRLPNSGLSKNLFILLTCIARIFLNSLLSLILVRWFTKKATSDWLNRIIIVVNCYARSISIINYYLRTRVFSDST